VSTDVGHAYWSLIRARLRVEVCRTCGQPLQNGTVLAAGEGTTLEEYGLSDTSVARLLAATELLKVRCPHCGAEATIGRSLVHRPNLRTLTADDLAQWSPEAAELYRSIVCLRLEDRLCVACGRSLRESAIEAAAGGAILPEFHLDDEAALTLIAWTQRLTVRCLACGAETKIE
jgi:predicted RNA-binding Zn-ribbon protein involved in translation (DUF1610 family)